MFRKNLTSAQRDKLDDLLRQFRESELQYTVHDNDSIDSLSVTIISTAGEFHKNLRWTGNDWFIC